MGFIGKGLNDYDKIFSILNSVGFSSWISIEDGMNGMEDLRESVQFLKRNERRKLFLHLRGSWP
jgi:sugar phosphate isomerase/epimerase